MDLYELISKFGLDEVEIVANIKKPVRNGDPYQKGTVEGFKPALIGAKVWGNSKHSTRKSPVLLKQAKVLVVYNAFTFFGKVHFDWISIDNIDFEIKDID